MPEQNLPSALPDPAGGARDYRLFWNLAAAGLLLRFLIMPYGGFPVDVGTFRAWAQALAEGGPAAFYGGGFADYLPGYLYVLWVIGEVNNTVRLSDQAYLFALKFPSAIADVATAWLVLVVARRFNARWALALAASYLFNPGIIFNGAYWGQADAVGAVFAVAGIAALGSSSPLWSAALLAAGAIVKPQTAPVVIPAGLYLLRRCARPAQGPARWDLLLGAAAAGAGVLVLAILPFGLGPLGLIGVLRTSLGVYPHSSVVAFNFWGATQGFWVSDGLRWLGVPLHTLGLAAALAAGVAVAVWVWRRPAQGGALLASAVLLLAVFVLPTRMHERYLLPAIPFFAAAAAVDRRMLGIYIGLSAVFALNLLYAYTRPYAQTFVLPGFIETTLFSDGATRLWSAIATLLLPAAFYVLFSHRPRSRSQTT